MWKYHHQYFVKNHRPLIMAHRGDSASIPENTIQAFEDAYQLHIDCIESDVHLTADNEFVLFHDEQVDRTTDGEGKIQDHSLADLKKLDAGYRFSPTGSTTFPFRGTGLKIHTLEEIIPLFPNVRFNLDIKSSNPEAPRLLATKLKKMEVELRIMVGSFHQKQIIEFRKHSRIATSAGPKEVLKFLWKSKLWKRKLAQKSSSELIPMTPDERKKNQILVFNHELPYVALQIPPKYSLLKIISPEFIRFAHFVGIAIHIWTINSANLMEKLLNWGADGIFTDKPRLLLDVWEKVQNQANFKK